MQAESTEAILFDAYPIVVTDDAVAEPRAFRMIRLLASGDYGGARLIEARSSSDGGSVALVVEVEVSLGQRTPVNDIRSCERVGIVFSASLSIPNCYPLRDNFPQDLPHFNLSPPGEPRSLCLYDVMPTDAARTYTGLTYLERVRWWLRESAHGRLHDVDQPLDPLFGMSQSRFILPPGGIGTENRLFVGAVASSRDDSPIILKPLTVSQGGGPTQSTVATITVVTEPVVQGRIHMLPRTLEDLDITYRHLNVELIPRISDALRELYHATGSSLLGCRLLMIIITPISRDGGAAEVIAAKGFVTTKTVKDVSVIVGSLFDAEGQVGLPLSTQPPGDLSSIELYPAELHDGFDQSMAVRTSGTPASDPRIFLIGAGALGSQLGLNAARGGIRRITVVDDDFILPHNLARHSLGREYLGYPKAAALADSLAGLMGSSEIASVESSAPGSLSSAAWSDLLAGQDLIVDASASLDVPRWLARDQERTSRAASCFLNPAGTDAVILLESADGSIRLDEVEMAYYWRVSTEGPLQGHLEVEGGTVRLGGCRHPSVVMPNTQVSALAGIAALRLFQSPLSDDAEMMLWRLNPSSGAVTAYAQKVSPFRSAKSAEWTVLVNSDVLSRIESARASAGELETGGVLVGHWDRQRKIMYVVGCYDPPPDSIHISTGFVRGSVGVFKTIEELERGTVGNLTYIGEWHTHPPRSASYPSSDDANVLRWTFEALQWSDAPGLIAICGEDGHRLIQSHDGTQQDAVHFQLEKSTSAS